MGRGTKRSLKKWVQVLDNEYQLGKQSGLKVNVFNLVDLENFLKFKNSLKDSCVREGWTVQLLILNTNELGMSWGLIPVQPVVVQKSFLCLPIEKTKQK